MTFVSGDALQDFKPLAKVVDFAEQFGVRLPLNHLRLHPSVPVSDDAVLRVIAGTHHADEGADRNDRGRLDLLLARMAAGKEKRLALARQAASRMG